MDAPLDLGGPRVASDGTPRAIRRDGAHPAPPLIVWGLPAALYLLAALVVWAGVWTAGPATVTTCGCGDAARFLWFFEWPAYAVPHGLNPMFSTWLFHPTGINLLDDTSVLGLSMPLLPVTWLAGPIASMNVALLLAPTLSALAMFGLVRRFATSAVAAFVAGLLFGFAPFMLSELALNQLNIAFLAIPPLLVAVADDLVRTKRRSDTANVVLLAGLVIVQFFVSTEMLAITAIAGLVGSALLLVGVVLRGDRLGAVLAPLVRPVAAVLALISVVLAWPLWFSLRGPGHLSGAVWSNGSLSRTGTVPSSFISPSGLEGLHAVMRVLGGYQGSVLPGLAFLGWANLVIVVGGLVVFWRDRRLWFLATFGLIAAGLSLEPGHGAWVPWTTLQHVVLIGQIVEIRFVAVVLFADAFLVALIMDRARPAVGARRAGLAVMLAIAAVVVIPLVVTEAPNLPLTVKRVTLPTYFVDVGSHLPADQVLSIYPAASSGQQASAAWQALNHMHYAQAGGGGPAGEASRAGLERPGFEVLTQASLPFGPPPTLSPRTIAAVRAALAGWGVTQVVVPDSATLPPANRGRGDRYGRAFFATVLGRPGIRAHGATTWILTSRDR